MSDETPDAAVAKIPIGQLTLREAAGLVTDGDAYWLNSMPAILEHYPSISLSDYWEVLTVDEHRTLLEWAKGYGVES